SVGEGSVESAELKDLYDGVVTTDARGEATVVLPAWFEALNEDFRYQLTVLGQTWAQARVEEELRQNRFRIKTSEPQVKVSWQVTGVRHDPYALRHPLQVEAAKAAGGGGGEVRDPGGVGQAGGGGGGLPAEAPAEPAAAAAVAAGRAARPERPTPPPRPAAPTRDRRAWRR